MNYEKVIKITKKIETILVDMGAEGKGLYEKVSSIENKIDDKTIKSIKFIATIRNKVVHDDNFTLSEELYNDPFFQDQ